MRTGDVPGVGSCQIADDSRDVAGLTVTSAGHDLLCHFGEFAVVAPVHDVAKKVRERCDGVIDRVLVGFPASIDEATVAAAVQEMRSA